MVAEPAWGIAAWRPRWSDLMLLAVIAAAVCFEVAFHTALGEPLVDLMHEGEYLAPRLFFRDGAGLPLLIHGQIDYLPALWAADMFGADRLVAGTRFVNLLCCAVAGLLYVACMAAMARNRQSYWGGALAAFAMIAFNLGREATSVNVSQGAPGLRDLFILAATLCLLLAERVRRQREANVWRMAAGLIVGATIFWSYNRGVTAVIALIGLAGAFAVLGPRRQDAIAPLAGLVIGFAALYLPDPALGDRHVANILYWAQHSDIWRQLFWSGRVVINLLILGVVGLTIAAALAGAGWRYWRTRDPLHLPILAWLVLICAIIAQQGLNRPDDNHMRMILPWALLVGWQAWALFAPVQPSLSNRELALRWWGIPAAMVGLLLVNAAGKDSDSRPLVTPALANAALLDHGLPRDRSLIAPDLAAAADLLRRHDPRCAFVFNNSGGFYHLADRVPCSTTMYPIYATGTEERRLLADLKRTRPPVVIYSSEFWFEAIDGKPQAERTPMIAAWIDSAYPIRRKVGRHVVAAQLAF